MDIHETVEGHHKQSLWALGPSLSKSVHWADNYVDVLWKRPLRQVGKMFLGM